MSIHANSSSSSALKSIRRRGSVIVLFSLLGFVLSQMMLNDRQESVAEILSDTRYRLCDWGIRIPTIGCIAPELVKRNPEETDPSLSRQFARLPNLAAAVDKLQWNRGTEADAAKLLTLIRNLELSRQRQTRENREAGVAIQMLIRPIWDRYPDLVTASTCIYCGNHFDIVSGLLTSSVSAADRLNHLAAGHPRLLRVINEQMPLEPTRLNEIASVHAEFHSPGDSRTAVFIGSILAEQNDTTRLKTWASKGLNGGNSLNNLDLDSLPLDLIITAWERGVSIGYDNVTLSRYLLSKGHRPTLRWIIWLEGSDLPYLHGWSYEHKQAEYQEIMNTYTAFPVKRGHELARYYSDNWKDIVWDEDQNIWR